MLTALSQAVGRLNRNTANVAATATKAVAKVEDLEVATVVVD